MALQINIGHRFNFCLNQTVGSIFCKLSMHVKMSNKVIGEFIRIRVIQNILVAKESF